MPKSRHLRDFMAIASSRSLRSAAASLGLTQPAISRSLQELEEELGVPLFERHTRGVVLTPAGEKYLVRAQIATESLRRGYEEARQFQGDLRGTLAVSLSSAAVLGLLPRAYPQFRKAWPAISVRFVEGQFPLIEPKLRDGELDFYIGPKPERELGSGYSVLRIADNERVIMARKDHPMRGAGSLAGLVDAEWLIAGIRDRVEGEFEEVFSAHGLASPAVRTRAESMLVLITLLVTTDALVFLPRVWASNPMFNGLLELLPVHEQLAAPEIVLMHSLRFPLTPAAEQLALLLQRAAGKPFQRSSSQTWS
ncbi:MAG: LysR substrate-binding domain-containing protein [Polaromonas sp.]|nr:LysR substrate-binding domain-containing protein [Polaromonas sp.]